MSEKTRLNVPVKRDGTRVRFQCRLSYCHLDKPHAAVEGAEPKYQVCCIVPKGDTETVEALKAAAQEAANAGVATLWGGKKPKLRTPFQDGDEMVPPREEFAGSIYLNAGSKRPVFLCNRMKEEVTPDKVYSGCHALVNVNFFPYKAGQNGVSAGLNSIMKTFDGERLGGGGDGRRDFDDLSLEEEDDDLLDL